MSTWTHYTGILAGAPAKCTYSCIFGLKENSIYAQSDNTRGVQDKELAYVVRCIHGKEPSCFENGLTLGGVPFTVVRIEEELIACRGKGDEKHKCLVMALSLTTLVVGENTTQDAKLEKVLEGVHYISTYLKQQSC